MAWAAWATWICDVEVISAKAGDPVSSGHGFRKAPHSRGFSFLASSGALDRFAVGPNGKSVTREALPQQREAKCIRLRGASRHRRRGLVAYAGVAQAAWIAIQAS